MCDRKISSLYGYGRYFTFCVEKIMNKHILVDQDVTVFIRYSLQARVSQDYHLEPEQWRIGMSSILASALNLAPSKDTFWTTEKQPGNPLYPGKRDDQKVQRLVFIYNNQTS